MSKPTVTALELAAIESVLGMAGGYVLDFSNRTFALFFEDLGIDIDADFPDGSKASRMRAFLRTAHPTVVAGVLEALLERGGAKNEGEASPQGARVRSAITRLRGTHLSLSPAPLSADVLSLDYVRELETKTDQRIAASDLEGAITTARTMLEAVLLELQRQLVAAPEDHRGDLQRLFKAVAKHLRMDEDRTDLDDNFKQVVRGLVQIVNGLAPIRNKMSDGHPRARKPAAHHARVIVNAAKTVATFLIDSYVYQRDKALLAKNRPGQQETR